MEIIGLDIGTTGCKASLFDQGGQLLGSASREYAVDFPHPAWAEQDGEAIWHLVKQTLRDLVSATGRADITAIGLSVHGEAVTAVDAHGNTLRPFILGMDTRTGEQNSSSAGTLARSSFLNGRVCRFTRSIPCPNCSGCARMNPKSGQKRRISCWWKIF